MRKSWKEDIVVLPTAALRQSVHRRIQESLTMKCVVFYETAAEGLAKAASNYPAHKARLDEFAQRGELLMVGPWANPAEGALAVFKTRQAAEEFVKEDPFVLNGVVSGVTLKDWQEILV
jgi:uncharacterized protein YciI